MEQPQRIMTMRKPPGPPPGRPPILSDNEDISDDDEGKTIINGILRDCFCIVEVSSATKIVQSNGKYPS